MDTSLTSLQEPRWATITRGILLVLFGLVALAWPGLTLVTFTWLVGIYVLAAGLVSIFGGIMGVGEGGFSWLRLLIGVLELGVGVYLIQHTGVTYHLLTLIMGLGLMVRGVLELVFAFNREVPSEHKGLLGVAGFFGILAGFIVLRYPVSSGLAWIWIIGIYALIAGPVTIVNGLRAR